MALCCSYGSIFSVVILCPLLLTVPRCLAYKVITLFPLHNFEKLKSMERKWYANFQKWDIPIGRKLALSFAPSYVAI